MNYEKNEAGNLLPTAKVFTFNPSNQPIQVEVINNEPWFVAADICSALCLQNPTDRVKSLDDDERLTYVVDRSGQKREVNLVNESGLYNLIFQSRKPEAKAFRKWVTSEVLPQIRRTGSYTAPVPASSGVHSCPRSYGDYIDLRSVSYEFRQINGQPVRSVVYNSADWYSMNDVFAAIGTRTESSQTARRLNAAGRNQAVKILLFGANNPAWFVTINGVKLILSASKKLRCNNPQQLQLTIGGLV